MQRAVLRIDLRRYLCDQHYNLEAWAITLDNYEKSELEFMIKTIYHKLKFIYEKERTTTYKFCDKCNKTHPSSADKCVNCGGGLREFEVPIDLSFFESIE